MTSYREATISDVSELLPLLAQLGYETTKLELTERLHLYVNSANYGLIVSSHNGTISGLIAWSKTNLFVSNKIRFHIEALIVDNVHRGLGLGKKLLEMVESLAKDHSPSIVDLTSGLRRKPDGTHQFYEVMGYHNRGLMEKKYLRKEF